MFNLIKNLRTFLHENALLTIGLPDQSGYSICLLYGQSFHPYSMNNYNGSDLLLDILFSVSPQLGGLGTKYQDLVIYYYFDEG